MGKKCVRLATVAKRRGRCAPEAVVTVEPAPEVLEAEVVEEAPKKKTKKKRAKKKAAD